LADGSERVKQVRLFNARIFRHSRVMYKLKRWALPAILLLASCASAAPNTKPQPGVHPALWKLADQDTTIYLFGTIHVLPKELAWRTPKFNAAAASAQELVLEVNDLEDSAQTAKTFMGLALSPGLPPVLSRVAPSKRAGLQKLINKAGVPTSFLDTMENWAVAVTLASATLKDLNVSPDDGVERQLTRIFSAAHKPVAGLETTPQQLGYFDTLSAKAQETFLESMVDDAEDADTEFRKMISAWSRGDEKAIALSFDDELKLSPELADILLRQRNRNWTAWLAKRMEKPGTIFVAVGAGHLAGSDSVQNMLAKQGFKTTRVQ
jgi:uncharacterized protein